MKENLRSWLLEDEAVDQFCIRYGDVTEILWNDLKVGKEPRVVEKRISWTESYVAWSPQGTYLLTIYSAHGVAIWGGAKWEKLMRFPHPGVKLIDFSPNEKYLVTASPQFQENDNPKDPQVVLR
jgi:translation initiation factor 3 subunit B